MSYISFTVITDTPVRLRNFLVARNVIEERPVGSGNYTGVLPGMEWVNVPNPIQTAPASGTPGEVGYIPPTYDNRSVFLVKFAHEALADQEADGGMVDGDGNPVNQYDWSRFGKWIKANSTIVTAPPNYLINGEPAGDAYKITDELVWLVRDNPERFGVWQ